MSDIPEIVFLPSNPNTGKSVVARIGGIEYRFQIEATVTEIILRVSHGQPFDDLLAKLPEKPPSA